MSLNEKEIINVILIVERELGEFALSLCLQRVDVRILAVLTDMRSEKRTWWDNSRIPSLAQQFNIPCIPSHDILIFEEMRKSFPRPDLTLAVLNNRFRSRDFLAWPRICAFNVHGAPLPEYQGNNCTYFAIMNGSEHFGITIYRTSEYKDEGPIVALSSFTIPSGCTNRELYELNVAYGKEFLAANIERVLRNSFTIDVPFDKSKAREYGPIETKEVDLTKPVEVIERTVRACYMPPFEPAFYILNGKQFFLLPESLTLRE